MKKRVLWWSAVLIGATLATSAAAHHPGSFMMPACGHTDGDSRAAVSVTDGVQMLRAAAGLSSTCELRDGTDVYYMASCDMNGDGRMTVSDGVNGLRAAAGLPVEGQCPHAACYVRDGAVFGPGADCDAPHAYAGRGHPPSDPPPGTAFADPPVAPSTRTGNVLDVTIEARTAADDLDGATATFLTYDGGFVAPVIQAKPGDLLRVHFTNALPANEATNILGHPRFVTNLHAHGLHVTPGTNPNGTPGDDVFRSVAAGGGSLDYEYDLSQQPAGSMGLYHPHQHGAVAEQIWGGMIGPIDVADEPGSPLAAYETHLLVLKDISLSGEAPAPYDSILDYMTGKEGNLVMVNGQVNPVLAIRPGQVQRWRIFNASTARFYRLSLEGHSLNVIGTDGGLLDRPYPVSEILVAPAERLDVLVQASPAAGSFRLLALPYDRGGMGMMGGMGGMPGFGGAPSAQVTLLTLDDAGAATSDVLPAQVDPAARRLAIDTGSLPRTRFVLGMFMGRGTINGVSFDEMADGTVSAYQHDSKVGTYEVWEIVNQTGMDHPWHQHVNSAQVLSANGPDPAFATYADLYTRVPGLKDTVIVPRGGSITLLVPVMDHPGKTVFHCHIVEHEDIGMMGIWNIEP